MDTRCTGTNVFTEILRPGRTSEKCSGMEIHSRRRPDNSEFTVLLNNMRVMVIPDWWHSVREYIFTGPEPGPPPPEPPLQTPLTPQQETPYELKLNITDSEVVVVQETARKDTNALTLRSTTVISWKPCSAKPLSCNLNHCELFSCVAGHEDDTALSIIDPVTIGVELSKNGVLEVQVQQRLIVRLSYHDFRMLAEMARSVPKQAQTKRKPSVTSENPHIEENVRRLASLGFSIEDCTQALEECNKELEEAALWLTQHAIHDQRHELEHPSIPSGEHNHSWTSVLVRASYLIVTIIDDCGDADVPLAEVCLAELIAEQPLGKDEGTDAENEGSLECKLSCDYYNRALSGWEPCLEPWRCRVTWQSRRRLFINVNSDSLLDINITSSLLELYRLVSDNWRRDMNQSTDGQVRRRRRFVPFALKNDTGSRLCFATVLASRLEEEIDSVDDIERSPEREIADDKKHAWKFVEPGETIPFEFSDSRTGKRRHGDTHRARLHRLRIQVSGWRQLAHVSVDRVGVYFRDITGREVNREPNSTRLVFDIQLEGSARKLVTVRSALVIINKLPDPVDVRLGATAEIMVKSGETLPVPLEYSHQQLHIRPTSEPTFSYCQPEIDWKSINQKSGETKHEARTCRIGGQRARVYHLSAEIRCEHKQEGTNLPAHTVVLMPAVLLINLLPHELHYTVIESDEDEEREFKEGPHTAAEGVIIPGMEAAVSSADPSERSLELQLRLEGFRCCSGVRLPRALPGAASSESQCILRLEDTEGRRLHLHIAIVTRGSTAGIRVVVSAPFWIINRTGLPLIFRQEGVATDTAGQFKEHEVARMVAPLLFSWTDSDASPSVTCRVGTKAVPGGQPHWCQHFHLRRGVQVRKLRVTHTGMGVIESITRPDTVFIIGIQVRFGRGRYRNTSIVTISPRYQIHNRSSKTLIFSQQCHATTISDPGARATHVEAVPGCQIPFHWPRLDKEHLLCVRCMSDPANTGSLWSGGLRIDSPRSLHVSIRTSREVGAVKFLRLEVVSRGATLHAVFGDSADTLPAPLRVDNRSEVTIQFAQQEVSHTCVAKARSCVPYAWDEPDIKQPILIVTAPGGASAMCNMDKLGLVAQLTYENFIYVAFTGTFGSNAENGDRTSDDPPSSPSELTNQRLVLDVLEDEGGKVSLAVKQPGRRSQLWRMTSKGQLHHEGSPADRVLVLDIEGPAPQPSRRDSRLALRRPDPRRRSTQTWRFTADGRLCCAHENMCVQSQDGVWGLKPGGAAVLGVPREAPPHRLIHGVPIEQAVGKQRMRPGSGFLSVEVTTDGPTRVLAVRDDIADKRRLQNGEGQNSQQLTSQTLEDGTEIRLVIRLNEGLGVSIVGRGPPQELLYTRLSNIVAEISHCSGLRGSRQLCLSIGDIQCDNQLFGTDTEVVVYAARSRGIASEAERQRQGPALSISAELQNPFAPKPSVLIFRHLIVRVNPLAVHIEETLLLRMAEFLGTERSRDKQQDTPDAITDHTGEDEIKPGTDTAATSTHTRFYFGVISLAPGMVRLSVRTAGKLPSRLRSLRRRLGLTLIQFEDACIEVEPYVRRHSCDTLKSTWLSVYAHFKEELVWQAATIVGNVDFLGGPLGLMNDVSEGVSGLINERSVGALVMNVTHGISNSAAKVTDALGDGLGRVFIMDEAHEETRQRIRRTAAPAPSGHLVAGIKGFGFGLLDGATGLFRHVYAGATSDGVQGAMAGVGRGLVGMVAKPVVGVLDLAGEAARAVRDSSRGTSRAAPARKRLPRVAASGPGELLPRYGSGKEARGQAYLHQVNGGDRSERFVAYGSLRRSSVDDLRLIVGSEKVRVVTRGSGGTMTVVTEVRLQDVTSCGPVCDVRDPKDSTPRHYVELAVRAGGESPGAVRRPRIRCDTEEIARWAARQVNFARKILSERRYTLHAPDGGTVSTPM